MTSKWGKNRCFFLGFWFFSVFFSSFYAYCFQMAPERQKCIFFFKMVPPWTAFLPFRRSFLTIFPCPLSFFAEKEIKRKIEKVKKTWRLRILQKWNSPWSRPDAKSMHCLQTLQIQAGSAPADKPCSKSNPKFWTHCLGVRRWHAAGVFNNKYIILYGCLSFVYES